MKQMKKLLLTRARVLFWIWCLPAIVLCLWYVTGRPDRMVTGYLLWVVWMLAGFWGINASVGLMRRPALRALDEDCDPTPLLELCQAVIAQNPKVVSYRVLEGWALFLLGREEEALADANLVEHRWKLRRSVPLLILWRSLLPGADPRRAQVLARLEKKGRLRPKLRRTLAEIRAWEETVEGLEEAGPELEAVLLARLEGAGCTRERVAAHMALGVYYMRTGRMAQAQGHFQFVVAHGGKLAVRTEAERFLCRLPADERSVESP